MEFLENSDTLKKDREAKKIELLGYSSDSFKRDSESRRWNPIDIYYSSQESFCHATSKIISEMKKDCRFIIVDGEEEKNIVDVLEVRYDSANNSIRIFPENCRRPKK